MNVSDIKTTRYFNWKKFSFRDYPVAAQDLLNERRIKKWLESKPDRAEIEKGILREPALVRVRYHDNGDIYEMMAHQTCGPMCCMHYSKPEDMEKLRELIEKQGQE